MKPLTGAQKIAAFERIVRFIASIDNEPTIDECDRLSKRDHMRLPAMIARARKLMRAGDNAGAYAALASEAQYRILVVKREVPE